MSCGIKNNSIFQPTQQYIKYWNGSVIAVEGPNTMEKLMLDQLRIPYKQILKGRIILKPSQSNYLLNFLGLGDNATYLCMTAQYDQKSKIPNDNYVNWAFADDLTTDYAFSQILTLSGNADHRIQQMYLTNPSATYSVSLDVMVAVIDDKDFYFEDNQFTISNLYHTDIVTRVQGESISILSNSISVAVIQLESITSIQIVNNKIILTLVSSGDIDLSFVDQFNAMQAHSVISWLVEDVNRNTSSLSPREDLIPPTINFTNDVISATGYSPVNSDNYNILYGSDFSLSSFTSSYLITKGDIITEYVLNTIDARDGLISLNDENITIRTSNNVIVSDIYTPGSSYSISFSISDIAGNYTNENLRVYFNVQF
jgi:hypothetical protein